MKANFSIFFLILILLSSGRSLDDEFKKEQLRYPRVRNAYKQKEDFVKTLLDKHQIEVNKLQLFIRAFKKEELVEVWGKNVEDQSYQKIISYAFCTNSGELGPKRRQGDYQIPEGFYHIDRFNPYSNFYLSLGINYPNQSDRILGEKGWLGGDIFVHGACVTVGCIPITDDKIMELYLMAVEAKNNGQGKIPVHIFPTHLTKEGLETLNSEYKSDTTLVLFWKNLQKGYQSFEESRTLKKFSVGKNGQYIF